MSSRSQHTPNSVSHTSKLSRDVHTGGSFMPSSRRWFLLSAPVLASCARRVVETPPAPLPATSSAQEPPVQAAEIEAPKATLEELYRFREALAHARQKNIERLREYRRQA